jgi:hypothetical protein
MTSALRPWADGTAAARLDDGSLTGISRILAPKRFYGCGYVSVVHSVP